MRALLLLTLLLATAAGHAQGRITAKPSSDSTGTPIPVTGTTVGNQYGLNTYLLNPTVGQGLTDAQLRATPLPVTGAFYQITQPISGSVSVSNLPASQPVSGSLSVSNFPATQPVSLAAMPSTPVTGTFWQSTQPVSGPLTDTQLRASAVPVSGTFWPVTQPVSIASMPTTAVTGTFWQATQPVSGAFFQATQPVSLASMPSTPVTGTFWQATQPVSLTSTTVTGSVAVTGPLTDTQIRATALPVSGTFFQSTQPISAASLPLPTGASTSALQTTGNTSVASIDTKTPALGQGLMVASVPVVLASNQTSIPVTLVSTTVTGSVATTVADGANIILGAKADA